MDRRSFSKGALIGTAGFISGSIIACENKSGYNTDLEIPKGKLINIADGCEGTGEAPKYQLDAKGKMEQIYKGNLYHNKDGVLGFSKLQSGDIHQFDAFLETGCYQITGDAIEMRVPSSIIGRRPGFGNPNGEFPMQHGTNIRFKTNGIRIGAYNKGINKKDWIDLRMSLPMIKDLGLYRDPTQKRITEIGKGAAIWLDMSHDSTTISNVRVAMASYGLLSTCFTDTIRVDNLHTADVDFPVYFGGNEDLELEGQTTAHWANSISNSCFADGDGPCVIKETKHFNNFSGWQFNNVHIVRQGRKKGIGPESCNLYWTSNGGQIRGGIIKEPGVMLPLSDGGSYSRKGGQIDADGIILGGSSNVIDTWFIGASGEGRANLRLLPGANKNVIRSYFGGAINGAIDLIIPKGCEENIVYCTPGMTILDQGTNTQFIGKEIALIIND
ncbi:hypothetical protein [Aquimarina agarivorans]|uniref:hypothetical protein n=1 Tax=Aquimarina agarivorans TaxID=980584 RepID=UPI000248E5BC|nr:hypothetical protein [Aquimarina agarivorans]